VAEQFKRVAIVGGGFSGAMLAARLAESGIASVLINVTPDFGPGVAYSTPFEGHLLNVRSNRMTAIEGRPDDFADWLKVNRPELADPSDFAPRKLYGDYVRAKLAAVEAAHPGLIERRVAGVAAVTSDGLALSDGREVKADAVVLCTGNPAPNAADAVGSRVIGDPWAPGALDRIAAADDIVIVGTGLTMVDMIQSLVARGWTGKATALSRRGLTPRPHNLMPDTPTPLPPEALSGPLSRRLKAVRELASRGCWRCVMEAFRPITADLWMQASPDERSRMVRHLRPWWDVHRHRIAARIGHALDALKAGGRLKIVAGRLGRVEGGGPGGSGGVTVHWSPRGGGEAAPLAAQWMIDCTGPAHSAATDPLTAPLIASGRARMDPLRLGLELDASGRVLHADGTPDPALFVLGPPARAAFWETIAVPDIRKRIEAVFTALTA
jgi:uncharacterized NAD(P)/FAD-binding protein YdhS